jgi:Fe2+ or Zn2+ uptake regulation protein
VTKKRHKTHDLVLEALVDFLLMVRELLHDHGLSVQPQRAVLLELLLQSSVVRGAQQKKASTIDP